MDELKKRFMTPPVEYSPAPFWAVNSTMDEATIRRSLKDLHKKGMMQVIIHPRTGLEVEYLSDDFWAGMDVIVSELERLGMKGWIYDEYNWPSGVAGGRLLRERPDFRQRCLKSMVWRRKKSVELKGPLVAAFDIEAGHRMLEGQEAARTFIPPRGAGSCLVFWEERMTDRTFATTCAPWVGSELGVLDYLNPEAVDYFMELTHREYARRYGDRFGKTLVGLFTDEPQNYRGLPWCCDFVVQFAERRSYDLLARLWHLVEDAPGAVETRCDFYGVAEELFAERYYLVVGRWCAEQGLEFTGHLGMEENVSLMAANHGGVYRAFAAMHMPGIDILGTGHGFDGGVVNSEVPNLAPKMVSSIAHLHGRKRCLVELWGGGGWSTAPAKLKKSLDWMFAMGVNFINPHQTWVSAKGLRKRDFPQSFGPQQPWWDTFRPFSDYIARNCALLSEGVHLARILLLFPIGGIHAASRGRGEGSPELEAIVKSLSEILDALLLGGHDFDIMFEEAIDRYRIEEGGIRAGDERFDTVVVPWTQHINRDTYSLLARAKDAGMFIAVAGPPPRFDDKGERLPDKSFHTLAAISRDPVAEIIEHLDRNSPPIARVIAPADRIVLKQHRRIGDSDAVFVSDLTGDKKAAQGPVKIRMAGARGMNVEIWNAEDGSIIAGDYFTTEGDDVIVKLDLQPGGSAIIVFSRVDKGSGAVPSKQAPFNRRRIVELDDWSREPLSRNILLLEPVRLFADRRKPRSLDRLRIDRRLGAKSKAVAIALRAAFRASRRWWSPERRYRYERYFDFGAAENGVPLAEKFIGIPISRLGLYEGTDLLDEWAEYFETPPGMGKQYPGSGEKYRIEARVLADHLPPDLAFVYEDLGEDTRISVNGRDVGKGIQEFVWDDSNRVVNVSESMRPGDNTIVFENRMPDFPAMFPAIHAPEPSALVGSFHIHEKRIIAPEQVLGPPRSWADEGLPYYFGAVKYCCAIELADEKLSRAMLDLGEVRDTAEVSVNGAKVGAKLWPPYVFDITDRLKAGANQIEVVARNTAANFFHRPGIKSGLLGPVRLTIDT